MIDRITIDMNVDEDAPLDELVRRVIDSLHDCIHEGGGSIDISLHWPHGWVLNEDGNVVATFDARGR